MKKYILMLLCGLLLFLGFASAGRPNPISWEEKQLLQKVYPLLDTLYKNSPTKFDAIYDVLFDMSLTAKYDSTDVIESKRARYGYNLAGFMRRVKQGASNRQLNDPVVTNIDWNIETDFVGIKEITFPDYIPGKSFYFVDAHVYFLEKGEVDYTYAGSFNPHEASQGRSTIFLEFIDSSKLSEVKVTFTNVYGEETGTEIVKKID